MNTESIQVPNAVRATAQRGLAAQRRQPINGAGGSSLAERLVTGEVTLDEVRRMRRFFEVNEREHRRLIQLQHTADSQAMLRSWLLYGGDSGKVWAEGVERAARSEGLTEEDPWIRLLRSDPEEVETSLQAGAWSWEYDMDARKAARFVEEYQRARGQSFDLRKAFGESARTVTMAVQRRISKENPFKQLARELMRSEYTQAARRDLLEHRECPTHGMRWPSFVAWTILGCHAPGLLREYEEGHAQPPMRGREPQPLMEYTEPVADYVTYFHPQGAQYRHNAPPGVLAGMDGLVRGALEGELTELEARDTLEEARLWTGRNKLATGLGHTLVEAWRRRDWPVIADALPWESDLRAQFERFRGLAKDGWLAERVVDTPTTTP